MYIKFYKMQSGLQQQKADQWLPGTGVRGQWITEDMRKPVG